MTTETDGLTSTARPLHAYKQRKWHIIECQQQETTEHRSATRISSKLAVRGHATRDDAGTMTSTSSRD
ncbi:hypothetical protein Pmar_PMAR007504 [Perkinsus marinus ATCC 50983]|uniref:Uncharacterized protein n=1 Tax=Perkinsus marinus (strain ATCC 50983 / TXsc) TaxID=423536 RepID=C5M075_PERM5|nr:hypothetical protein Pmar_PMAR007504 [Perkinsus marinus ATCC 50983]EEQ97653.1 hypothetical protein Pmar_PMAR007504 [Perkinsus marinus ATCC 50983]|eukprot:XP_002764936.1 hypothetical protein Pmar_PMAR007504 [Perkinsus marinus ATCC 50983]